MAAKDIITRMSWDRYVYLLYAGDDPLPFYVGVGKDGKHGMRRHRQHMQQAHTKRKSNPAKNQFIRDCMAAGIKINWTIWPQILTDKALVMEVELIAHFGRRDLGTGCLFNADDGGFGSRNPAPSTRAKMAASACSRKPMLGKRHSQEARTKISTAALGNKWCVGREVSPVTRAKLAKGTRRFYAAKRYTPNQGDFGF
jgi:NUMOD3 motif